MADSMEDEYSVDQSAFADSVRKDISVALQRGNAQAMILSASESVSTVLPAELTTASLATTPGSY